MALTLDADITATGMNQGDLYKLLSNIVDIVNELQTDHATLLTDITNVRTALVGVTAQLDLDGGVTDTTYASGNDPDAISTASLTNSTALTLAG